jgi:hypothetical protein
VGQGGRGPGGEGGVGQEGEGRGGGMQELTKHREGDVCSSRRHICKKYCDDWVTRLLYTLCLSLSKAATLAL